MAARPLEALPPRVAGALLCLAISTIHTLDQGGFPGDESPRYFVILFYLVEATGVLAAVLLLAARRALGAWLSWLLALGIAIGPMSGYLLTRTVGLPGHTDDIGNWTEPLGMASLAVEGTLAALALSRLIPARRL